MSATPAPVPAAVPAPTPPKDKDDDLISRMMRRNMFDWDEPAEPVEPIPLSDAVQPLHYDLALRPDLQRLRSEGEVTIKCQATTPVREVTLSCHSSISIRHLSLIAGDRTHSYDTSMLAYSFLETSDSDVKLDRRRGQLVLKVPDDLDLETFDILMAFSGNISEQPRGLYHCSYSYTGDDKCMDDLQHYAVFTGSNAHHVFPCFDDARFKATVRLSIIGWLDRKALSNTPVDEEAYWSGQTKTRCMRPSSSGLRSSKITRFKTTHAIALDELTFALGEFKAVNSGPVTVWTTPEHERASFAAEVLAKALPELARFGAPSKVDILAVGNLDGEAQARPGLLITLADRLLVDTAAPLSTQIDAGTLLMQETLKLRHPHGLADFLGRYIVAPKCFPEWETRDTFWSDRERDARRFKAEDLELGSSAMMAALYREKGEEPFLAAVENGNLKTPTEAPKLVRISATSWHADGPGYQAILLSDCWAFARAGHHPLSVALDLIKTLAATSDSHVIWDAIVACVDDLPELGGVVAQDAERMANQLGLTRQSQVLPARLQAIVVRLAAKQPQLLVSLQEAYDGGDIAPEIRGEVFRAVSPYCVRRKIH